MACSPHRIARIHFAVLESKLGRFFHAHDAARGYGAVLRVCCIDGNHDVDLAHERPECFSTHMDFSRALAALGGPGILFRSKQTASWVDAGLRHFCGIRGNLLLPPAELRRAEVQSRSTITRSRAA